MTRGGIVKVYNARTGKFKRYENEKGRRLHRKNQGEKPTQPARILPDGSLTLA